MSVKYHINTKTSRPNICRANVRSCPVGGDHFDSKQEAQLHIEKDHEKEFGKVSTLSNSSNANPPRPRNGYAIEDKRSGNPFVGAKVENGVVSFPDGYETELVVRSESAKETGVTLRRLMNKGSFDSLSPEDLSTLKSALDSGEQEYTDKEKSQILRVFSISSTDAIYKLSYDARSKWRKKFSEDAIDYKYDLPLGTQADREQFNERRKDAIINSYATDGNDSNVNERNSNSQRIKTPRPRKGYEIERQGPGSDFAGVKVVDDVVSFPDGYKTKLAYRGKAGEETGSTLRGLMDRGRFESLSPEDLSTLKSVLDDSEEEYSDREKKQVLKVFSMSSKNSIGLKGNYEARSKWRDKFLKDAIDYKYDLPLGTQAERKKYKRNNPKVNSTAQKSTAHVEKGDSVISLASIKNTIRDFIPKGRNRKEVRERSKNLFGLIFR